MPLLVLAQGLVLAGGGRGSLQGLAAIPLIVLTHVPLWDGASGAVSSCRL